MANFVTAIWDNSGPMNLARVLAKMSPDGRTSVKRHAKGKPTGFYMAKLLGAKCYAFDDWTADAFQRNGITPIRLADENPYWNTNLGQWCRKAAAMRHAVEHFGPSLWVDFDCALVRDVPPDFWDAFAGGGDLKTCLLNQHSQCDWRPGQRYWASGYYYYARRPEILTRMVELMMGRRDDRHWTDETVICYVIDELAGGWHGPDAYYANGYHAPFMQARTMNRRCENPVFVH